MLEYIAIRDFAIIDDLSLPFFPGLTVLTGETGAGKSMIVDGLQAVLGGRVDSSMVRTGFDSSLVEARFGDVAAAFPDGVDPGEGELVLSREIRREGRGKAMVDGSLASLSLLRTMGEDLVDFHGQHEHQSLLASSVHLEALDRFAGLLPLRRDLSDRFGDLAQVRSRISAFRTGEKERLARRDYLQFVLGELRDAAISGDEEQRLLEEERILSSAEKLHLCAHGALEDIYEGEMSAFSQGRSSLSSLSGLLATDGRLREIVGLLEGAVVQLEESGFLLRDYAASVEADPARLGRVQERLVLLSSLKKKYGPTMADVLRTLQDTEEELAGMEEGESGLEDLVARETELAERTENLSGELGRRRREAAEAFREKVQGELSQLAMEKVRFEVSFQDVPMRQMGAQEVEFLISPNPGEPLMPLRKIASGGELSRIMLALKRVLAGSDRIGTLVFDEVDAGIGGRVASILGRKLKDISRHHQVLCITHLAPVAAFSDRHLLVEKTAREGRTVIKARYLEGEERVRELARMIGGLEIKAGSIESAKGLLEEARG